MTKTICLTWFWSDNIFLLGGKIFSTQHQPHDAHILQGPLWWPTFSSCGGLRPLSEILFCPFGSNNYAVFALFWCAVVTLVTLSSNLCNVEEKKSESQKTLKHKKKTLRKNHELLPPIFSLSLARLVCDPSSPIHPVSESKRVPWSLRKYGWKSLCLILDVKAEPNMFGYI